MIDANEFATFMVSEDADQIVSAFNKLHGNARATFVAHLQVIASMAGSPIIAAPVEQPASQRLIGSLAPEVRTHLFRKGVFLSETPEGRVLERKARGHKLPDIAKAEFPQMELAAGVNHVREILASAKTQVNADHKTAKDRGRLGPKRKSVKRRSSESVMPLKERAVELRKLGISTGLIVKAIGEPAFFVTRAVQEAKVAGINLPDVDATAEVPPEMMGRHTIPGFA